MDNRSVPDALRRIQEVRAAREAALAAVQAAETKGPPAAAVPPEGTAAPAEPPTPAASAPSTAAAPIEPVVEPPPSRPADEEPPPPPPRKPEALHDDELCALAEALGPKAPPALAAEVDRELERRGRMRALALRRGEVPGVPGALLDQLVTPLRHFGTVLGLLARHVLVMAGIAVTIAAGLYFKLGVETIGVAIAFIWGSWILRLLFANVRFTADAARGRPTTSAFGPPDRTRELWLALLFFELAPNVVAGEALRPLAGTELYPVVSTLLSSVIWTALAVAALGVVDLGIGAMAAIEAQVRASRGRRLALLVFVAVQLLLVQAPLEWVELALKAPRPALRILYDLRDLLLTVGGFVLFLIGVARLHAGWASVAAREAAPTPGRFVLASGAPPTWRSQVAQLALLFLVFRPFVSKWFLKLQAELPGSVWTTLVLVPLLVAGILLLDEHLRGRRIHADEAGLLLDPGPRWPGTRVAWADVRGYRHIEGAVQLVVAGLPGLLGPRIPVANDEERAAVGALLESKKVRADA